MEFQNSYRLGCGMAAAIAAGVYKDYQEAAAHMVHVARRVYPNPQRTRIHSVRESTKKNMRSTER